MTILRCSLPFFLLLSSLPAQFANLATNHDGSVLYFDTSLRQKDTEQPGHGKIFSVDTGGLRPYAARDVEKLPGPPAVTNFYDLSEPSVSGDGRVVAYAGRRDCMAGRPCVGLQFTATTITGVPGRDTVEMFGRVRLSRNGRFAFVYRTDSLDSSPAGLWDLETGRQLTRDAGYSISAQPVADDGTTVTANFGLRLTRNGEQVYVGLPTESCEDAVIDSAGRTIAYISRWWEPHNAFSRLRLFDPVSGSARTLAEGFGDVFAPAITADGRTVLFLSTARFSGPEVYGPAQAFIIRTDGTGLRQLTNEPAGIRSAALSGDGQVAFALTGGGRLVRIETATASAAELIARTPALTGGRAAAGSLYTFTGAGLIDEQGCAPRITIGGEPVPMLSASPTEILVQIPWEASSPLRFETTSASSFEPPPAEAPFSVVSRSPNAWPLPPEYGTQAAYGMRFALAAHQNFEGLLTEDSPARRGEIVHLYATGLGPVDPPVATGQPGPADPPARIRGSMSCSIPTPVRFAEAPVLFAGLAPSLLGIYQMDLRIPADLPVDLTYPNQIQIQCKFDDGISALVTVIPFAP